MIESINISDVATYADTGEELSGLSKFNFIFGSNGTGKTTIGRIIAHESKFPTCSLVWKSGAKLETLVYNIDFVERNFNQSVDLKGVFTLGEDQLNTISLITAEKNDLERLNSKIEILTKGLQGTDGSGGKKGEKAALELKFKEQCWNQKRKHDAKLKGGFDGYRRDGKDFKNKILSEHKTNSATLLTQANLESKSDNIFGSNPVADVQIQRLESTKLVSYENDPVLQRRVIGKEDVDVASLETVSKSV